MDQISFNQIPVDLRVPGSYLEIDNTRALRGLPGMPSRILVIGQRLATGTVAAAVPTRVLDVNAAEGFFGRGSMLHLMFRACKANNAWTETWAIALDDAVAGVAATGKISFIGPATAAGTIVLYIAGQRVKVAVASGDAAIAVAAAVVAAINARTDLPVTAAVNGVSTFQVDLTARHKGAAGNDIDIRFNYNTGEALPAGIVPTITAMAGGTTNPDVAAAIAVLGQTWYTDIAMPYTDATNLAALESELADRFGPLVMKDGHAYAAAAGTHATLTTLGNSRNSPHLTIMGAKASPTPPYEWAAALCAVCAYYARNDPARPFQTLTLKAVLPPAVAARFTDSERNLLLFDAISTWTVDDGGLVRIERVITTYEKNALGIDDITYLDLNTMKTLAFIRYTVRARIALRFPRAKLASDGNEGPSIVTPRTIRGELVALFAEWEAIGIAEGIEQFKADLVVQRNAADPNRVDAIIPPDVINQFRVFAGKVEFRL